MKVAITGAGGFCGYFGAKLALGGNDVSFIARGEHLEVQWLSGDASSRGQRRGVPTPRNSVVCEILAVHAEGAR